MHQVPHHYHPPLIKFLVVLAVVVCNPGFDDFKSQITNAAEEAVLLSTSCSPSDASQTRLRSQLQITNHNFASLQLQITNYEGVNEKLITNGNEGIKLIEAIEEAKDAEDAEEADEADVHKEEAMRAKKAPNEEAKEAFRTCSE